MVTSVLELRIPPVLLAILFALLMWLISRLTTGMALPPVLQIAAPLLLCAGGVYIGAAGVAAFRKVKTTVNPLKPETSSRLVISGIFKRTRNPMYLALLLFLTAWGLYLANPFSLLGAAAFIPYMNRFQIRAEERALKQLYGAEFETYMRQVRRWI
jgi:protein-S-isoprenylcysteine O-methyltransferase Ste14